MAITKQKKVEILDSAKKFVDGSESIVFVNFHGLTVQGVTSLRKDLKTKGIDYTVVKKTLLKRALNEAKIEGEMPALDGELAMAYGNDAIAPAREVYEFCKTHKDQIRITGGIFQGRYMNAIEMTDIATIPSLKVLHGQFVNIINSPIQKFVMALDQIAQKKTA